MKTILFASHNQHKVDEVKDILKDTGYEVISLRQLGFKEEIEETGETFLENALQKAMFVYKKFHVPVIADDSGVVVGKLNGEPGIYSARYAGEHASHEKNRDKLIKELKRFPEPWKATQITTAVYFDGANELSFTGEMHGRIVPEERGAKGWAYDPIFYLEEWGKTVGELPVDIKNRMSHRCIAFRGLVAKMDMLFNNN